MEVVLKETTEILESARIVSDSLACLGRQIKSLERKCEQRARSLEKRLATAIKKKSRQSGGFSRPVPISEELCSFLDRPAGSYVARTEVTKQLNVYIKDHNLQRDADRRIIDPDDRLTRLLGTSDGVSFFDLQGKMNKHFVIAPLNIQNDAVCPSDNLEEPMALP